MNLEAIPRELLVAIAAVTTLYAIVVTLQRTYRGFERRLRFDAARRGEKEARFFLEKRGYDVLGEQVTAAYEVVVDGAPITISLSADYLVARNGRRFVAEVKTGEAAPKIETRATRRQLLEYHVAFGADGVLLVDMTARAVREVVFPIPEPRSPPFGWAIVLALVAVGIVAFSLR